MEEAYDELYQEFLRLRSLCLRQAALLHQLATKNSNASAAHESLHARPSGGFSRLSSPALCGAGSPECFRGNPGAGLGAAPSGISHVSSPSELLAEDMSTLLMSAPGHTDEDGREEHGALHSSAWDSAGSRRSPEAAEMPLMQRGILDGHLPDPDPSFGPMSDVTLRSYVCEFCQAAFPGYTSTRGEFLRHLCTHFS